MFCGLIVRLDRNRNQRPAGVINLPYLGKTMAARL